MIYMLILITGGLYTLFSIGVATIARRRGLKALWRAWVPFVALILLAAIADDISHHGTLYSKRVLGSLIIFFLAFISNGVRFIPDGNPQIVAIVMIPLFLCGWVGAMVYVVTLHQSLYCIYKAYTTTSAVIYTAIGLFFPFIIPVFLFTIKDYTQKFGIR